MERKKGIEKLLGTGFDLLPNYFSVPVLSSFNKYERCYLLFMVLCGSIISYLEASSTKLRFVLWSASPFSMYKRNRTPLSLILQEQVHFIEQALVFRARFHDINSCRLDAGVAKQVRQLRDIFFEIVERPGKQVAQVVGEYLLPRHVGTAAQGFEQLPDRDPAEGFSLPGEKNRPVMDMPLLAPAGQPVAELGRQ